MKTIREIIRNQGLTQKAFAEKFNIPLITVESWATGRRKPPEYVIEMILKILELENN